MPLYDYKCSKCQQVFEIEKQMTDKTIPKCAKCKTDKNVYRVFSAPSLSGLPTVNWRAIK